MLVPGKGGQYGQRKTIEKSKKLKLQNRFEEIENIIVSGQGLVPLTDELIEKLVSKIGIPRQDLIKLQKGGAQYSPLRNSGLVLTSPTLCRSLQEWKLNAVITGT